MGVPKFYRWISERYPCLSEVVKDYQIPEFDNLYLDMNGIIHVCSHPNDDDPHFRITEEKIFRDIFHYLEVLFRIIKPRKVFFMAVDGVAPRAKMNQQRGRRFKSAREAEDLIRQALDKGETLPEEERFDSNCITPGTEFMDRLHKQLQYFVHMKITNDRLWQGVNVYLSGHETPGEGEHKIMEYIRYTRSQPGYDPNTRHCLYGLDADLIMLGLTTHEPHFALLREEVRFGKGNQTRVICPEDTVFHLLHLSLMREYLELEFSQLKQTLPFPFDLEAVIDDWVLMGFLVGNDFIPHLPRMHIKHNALPQLYKMYMKVLPTLDGYLNEGGYLNLKRFEQYIQALAQYDLDSFEEEAADMRWFLGKCNKSKKGAKDMLEAKEKSENVFDVLMDIDREGETEEETVSRLRELGMNIPDNCSDDEDEAANDDDYDPAMALMMLEFQQHKRDYYMNKLAYERVTPEVLKNQAYGYIEALQWNLHYYYHGVQSWSWFYPHHYAPYISDIKDFAGMELKFEKGKPFLPYEQLLAVLPAASKSLLPKAFQGLMTSDNSPVRDFYPVEFETDLNGKQHQWEAVVLIPFIEEERLLEAMDRFYDELTPEERVRNKHGPCYLYEYLDDPIGTYPSSHSGFPDIVNSHAKCTDIEISRFVMHDFTKVKKGLLEGVKHSVYFPGFPTMKHLKYTAELRKEGVKVFQMNSNSDNMMLHLQMEPTPDLEKLSHEILGKSIYINWPHLVEARVFSVSSKTTRYYIEENKNRGKNETQDAVHVRSSPLDETGKQVWTLEASSIATRYKGRYGIIIGETEILLSCCPIMGRKYLCGVDGKITLKKQFEERPVTYAYQATVKDIAAQDPSFKQFKTLNELFTVGAKCFMLGHPHYASMGEVMEIDPRHDGRIRIRVPIIPEPDIQSVIERKHELETLWMPGYMMAQRLGITGYLLSRVTGTFYLVIGSSEALEPQKTNVGLNLKFNKKNEEVPGYTKKKNSEWLYSQKAEEELSQYIQRFPELFQYLAKTRCQNDIYHESDIYPDANGKKCAEIATFLKTLECYNTSRVPCGTEILENAIIQALEEENANTKTSGQASKSVKMQVRPHLLYRPIDNPGCVMADAASSFQLFDRVINVREGYSVPLGLRGTIIGIIQGERDIDVMYDVLFDEPFTGAVRIRGSSNQAYRVPAFSLLNFTHGERSLRKGKGVTEKYSKHSAKTGDASYSKVTKGQEDNPQRFNHSPNSPFITQQNNSRGYYPDKAGQFITLKGPQPSNPSRSNLPPQQQKYDLQRLPTQHQNNYTPQSVAPFQQQSHGHRYKVPPRKKPKDEFSNIWADLQQSSTASYGNKLNVNGSKSKALESRETRPHTIQPGGYPGKQPKASLQQAAQALEESRIKFGKTIQQSQNSSIENSTKALKQLLNINDGTKSVEGKHVSRSEGTASGQSDESYGVPVSLDDLFKTAKEVRATKQGGHSEPVKQGRSQWESSSFASQNPTIHPGSYPPSFSAGPARQSQLHQMQSRPGIRGPLLPNPPISALPASRKAVHDLALWCKNAGLNNPVYEFFPKGNDMSAKVSLSNGLKLQGSLMRTRDEAAESAAGVALMHLASVNPGFFNQFFRPPQSHRGYPGLHLGPPLQQVPTLHDPKFSPRPLMSLSVQPVPQMQLRGQHPGHRSDLPSSSERQKSLEEKSIQKPLHEKSIQGALDQRLNQKSVAVKSTPEKVSATVAGVPTAFIPLQVQKAQTPVRKKSADENINLVEPNESSQTIMPDGDTTTAEDIHAKADRLAVVSAELRNKRDSSAKEEKVPRERQLIGNGDSVDKTVCNSMSKSAISAPESVRDITSRPAQQRKSRLAINFTNLPPS